MSGPLSKLPHLTWTQQLQEQVRNRMGLCTDTLGDRSGPLSDARIYGACKVTWQILALLILVSMTDTEMGPGVVSGGAVLLVGIIVI